MYIFADFDGGGDLGVDGTTGAAATLSLSDELESSEYSESDSDSVSSSGEL